MKEILRYCNLRKYAENRIFVKDQTSHFQPLILNRTLMYCSVSNQPFPKAQNLCHTKQWYSTNDNRNHTLCHCTEDPTTGCHLSLG